MSSILYFVKKEFDNIFVLFTTNTNIKYRFYDLYGFTHEDGTDINNETLQYNLMFAFMIHA